VGGGFQHIGGPDKNGYLYVKGYRIEETPPYPANRLVTHPTVQALLGEEDATRPEESVCPGPVAVGSAVADQEEEVFSTQEAVVVQPAEPGDGGMILNANFPNPFNARTEIRFVLSEDGPVDLSFFNLAGQKVATLIEEVGVVGVYTVVWDGNDDEGRELASGIYLYRLTTSTGKMTRKLLLLR
jgi:hypothetical protein